MLPLPWFFGTACLTMSASSSKPPRSDGRLDRLAPIRLGAACDMCKKPALLGLPDACRLVGCYFGVISLARCASNICQLQQGQTTFVAISQLQLRRYLI